MKIKGQYQWTYYLKAELLHRQRDGFSRIIVYGVYSIVAVLFVRMLYIVFLYGDGIEDIIPGLLFILAVSYPFLHRKYIFPKHIKKSFAQHKELSFPFEFEFTETGMHITNELGRSTLPWEYFTKWKEDEDTIILYESEPVYHIISKRLFADPQQIEMVKSLLGKNNVANATRGFRKKGTG